MESFGSFDSSASSLFYLQVQPAMVEARVRGLRYAQADERSSLHS